MLEDPRLNPIARLEHATGPDTVKVARRAGKGTYSLLVDVNLFGNRSTLSATTAENVSHAVDYIKEIHGGFAALGMRERRVADFNLGTSEPSYIWRELATRRSDVIWIEAHGSVSQGVIGLPIETVAQVRDRDRGDDWARLNCKLLVFGSCFTAGSDVWELLPRIVETECVVVGALDLVKFADGRHYPELIAAWGEHRTSSLKQIAARLSAVAPDVFVVKVVAPKFDDDQAVL